jgi:hypothetical protein
MSTRFDLPDARPLPKERAEATRQQLVKVVAASKKRWTMGWRTSAIVAIAVSLGVGGSVAIAVDLTKGAVPIESNGTLDLGQAPDFIIVVGGSGQVVGYVPRSDLVPQSANASMPVSGDGQLLPVYGPDLSTLVGHLYPGVGYVKLGVMPTTISCPTLTTTEGNGLNTSVPCPSFSVSLPNIVGESTPVAAASLSKLGLTVNVVDVRSSTTPRGYIVSMSPISGSVVASRSIVTIENSLGPR